MRLQEFDFEVEFLPGDQNVVADYLSGHFHHMRAGAVTAIAGHLAYATAGRCLDVAASGRDMCDPQAWCASELVLVALWHS